jgi:hypothetical protein
MFLRLIEEIQPRMLRISNPEICPDVCFDLKHQLFQLIVQNIDI